MAINEDYCYRSVCETKAPSAVGAGFVPRGWRTPEFLGMMRKPLKP